MENTQNYSISYGEFVDKVIEREFLNYDMRRNAKFIGPVTLIFGIIYMLFIVFDYYDIENKFSLILILVLRALVFVISIAIFLYMYKITNYANLVNLITAYEIIAVISFLMIIYQYESITYLTLYSVMAITLAIYTMPNRLINEQVVSAILVLSFFIFPAKNLVGLDASDLLKAVAYNFLIVIFCNIGAYMTNFYKRKQFADSRELLRASTTDSLTETYNRVKFSEELNRWIDSCNKYETPLSLTIFDVDDFKRVNDRYGHLIGDSVLRKLASTIKMEIRNTDIFARWGGEEFVILFPNTDIQQAMKITERMRNCIQKGKYDKVENITCSFGLVALRKNENAESLIKRADKLLYDAKNLGKNAVVCEGSKIGVKDTSTYAGIDL